MRIYNTQSKKITEVKPIIPGIVSMYTCGPTVYDYLHIGNWFAFIRWDLLARTLRQEYDVNWVMNITDVGHLVSDDDEGQDKLEKGAKREGKTAWEVAAFYGEYFNEALNRLNFSDIKTIPKATDHIQEQIDMVKTLEDKGYAYVIEDGVYFDTSKLDDYGKLTNIDAENLKAGIRVEMCPGKKNVTDFALWKFSPKNEQRDMEWESPWGKGFPGWHIECSAMSIKYLGETIDIHCGGIDHIPVHHTNEIAQSETATGKTFSNIWVHGNFIKVDGKKMSKSLGNLVTLEDIEKKDYSLQDFRMLVLESHYRNEAQFTWDILEAAHNRLQRWQSVADLRHQPTANEAVEGGDFLNSTPKRVLAALNEDLNTPIALQIIDETFDKLAAEGVSVQGVVELDKLIDYIELSLGIQLRQPDISSGLKSLIAKRQSARQNSDWKESDQIRDELAKQGIGIKDTAAGQIWERI